MDVGQHSSISEHINFTDCPTESICHIPAFTCILHIMPA